MSEQDLTSPSTWYRLFWRRIFPVSHLHALVLTTNQNIQETEHKQTQINAT